MALLPDWMIEQQRVIDQLGSQANVDPEYLQYMQDNAPAAAPAPMTPLEYQAAVARAQALGQPIPPPPTTSGIATKTAPLSTQSGSTPTDSWAAADPTKGTLAGTGATTLPGTQTTAPFSYTPTGVASPTASADGKYVVDDNSRYGYFAPENAAANTDYSVAMQNALHQGDVAGYQQALSAYRENSGGLQPIWSYGINEQSVLANQYNPGSVNYGQPNPAVQYTLPGTNPNPTSYLQSGFNFPTATSTGTTPMANAPSAPQTSGPVGTTNEATNRGGTGTTTPTTSLPTSSGPTAERIGGTATGTSGTTGTGGTASATLPAPTGTTYSTDGRNLDLNKLGGINTTPVSPTPTTGGIGTYPSYPQAPTYPTSPTGGVGTTTPTSPLPPRLPGTTTNVYDQPGSTPTGGGTTGTTTAPPPAGSPYPYQNLPWTPPTSPYYPSAPLPPAPGMPYTPSYPQAPGAIPPPPTGTGYTNPYYPSPTGAGGALPLPNNAYTSQAFPNWSTWNGGNPYTEGDPGMMATSEANRAVDYGNLFQNQFGGAYADARALEGGYRGIADDAYSRLYQNPGFNASEADMIQNGGIAGGLNSLRASEGQLQNNFFTPQEMAAIQGDPNSVYRAFDPNSLNNIANAGAADTTNFFNSNYGLALNGLDSGQARMDQMLAQYGTGGRGALATMRQDIMGAIDPTKLGISEDQVRKQLDSASRGIGAQYGSAYDQMQRQAEAAGNVSPLALAAARDRLMRAQSVAQQNAVTDADIRIRDAQRAAERDISDRYIGAGTTLGNANLGFEGNYASAGLGANQAMAGLRAGTLGQYGNLGTNLGLQTTKQLTDAANTAGQTAIGQAQYADTAASQRAGQLAQNRQATNIGNLNTAYTQGMGVGDANTRNATTLGQQRISGEQAARNYWAGQTQYQGGQANAAAGQQVSGAQTSLSGMGQGGSTAVGNLTARRNPIRIGDIGFTL